MIPQVDKDVAAKLEGDGCDFCDAATKTLVNTFGRVETEHTIIGSSVAKYDGWHALTIMKGHHPLKWTEAQLVDALHCSMKWFVRVHSQDPSAVYPVLLWDVLGKASASQIHPHLQVGASRYPVQHTQL